MRTTINTALAPASHATSGDKISIFARIRAALITRRQRRALARLDDRMLADIGISRGQAYGEADRAFFDLPGAHR